MQIKLPTNHCIIDARRFGTADWQLVHLGFQHVPENGIGSSCSVNFQLTPDDARALATELADLADEIDALRQLPPNATLEATHANR